VCRRCADAWMVHRYLSLLAVVIILMVTMSNMLICCYTEHSLNYRTVLTTAMCRCMDGSSMSLHCRRCSAPWSGAMLLIGTMYSYDVFAATPCCDTRLQCKQCHQSVFGGMTTAVSAISPPLKYYSEYRCTLSLTPLVSPHFFLCL